MLERKILQQLNEWKNRANHKSLIITGQRQVGKTYIVEKVLSKEYGSFIKINFVEKPELIRIFEGNLDVDTIMEQIAFEIPGASFISGDTLLLFDEVQECPNAIVSLKFWTEKGDIDVIAMGSSLGMNYAADKSFPVGYVEYLRMYSLDFEEFLWADGLDKKLVEGLKKYFDNREKVPPVILKKMNEYLKKYMIVGGMPEVVTTYIDTKDLSKVHQAQNRLIQGYNRDIARYASADVRIKAQRCYESIPFQLSKENHKFQYSKLESKATSSKYESSVEWLEAQLIIARIHRVKRIEYPIEAFEESNDFRVYMTDIGMLIGRYDESLKKAILNDGDIENASAELVLGLAKGGLYEALAADMLYKRGYDKLYYYRHEKNTSEIEFLLMKEGQIVPIEIKASKKRANSLKGILLENNNVSVGYKLSSNNVGCTDGLITLPMFMLMFM